MRLKYQGARLEYKPFTVEISSAMKKRLFLIYDDLREWIQNFKAENKLEGGDQLFSDRLLRFLQSLAKSHAHLWGRGKITSTDVKWIKTKVIPWLERASIGEVGVMSRYDKHIIPRLYRGSAV